MKIHIDLAKYFAVFFFVMSLITTIAGKYDLAQVYALLLIAYDRLNKLPYWGYCKVCGAVRKGGYCSVESCKESFEQRNCLSSHRISHITLKDEVREILLKHRTDLFNSLEYGRDCEQNIKEATDKLWEMIKMEYQRGYGDGVDDGIRIGKAGKP